MFYRLSLPSCHLLAVLQLDLVKFCCRSLVCMRSGCSYLSSGGAGKSFGCAGGDLAKWCHSADVQTSAAEHRCNEFTAVSLITSPTSLWAISVPHFCAVLLILLLLPYPKECINQIKIYHTFHGCILLLYTLPSVNSYTGAIMTFLNHALRFSNAFHSYSQVWTDPGRQAFLTLLFIFLISAIVYSQAYSL